jgi:hypothetical protein
MIGARTVEVVLRLWIILLCMLIVPVDIITFARLVVGLLILQSLIVTDEAASASIAGWVAVAPVNLHSVKNAVPSKKLIAFPTVPVILQL